MNFRRVSFITKGKAEIVTNDFSSFLISGMLMQILLSGSKSAPDMALRLICIKHPSGCQSQRWVDLNEPLCHIFMYCTLTNPKLLRSLPHSCIILYNIACDFHGSLFDILFQKAPPANVIFTMYAGRFLLITSVLIC